MGKNILVCVAWPYVNGDLHIGHFAGALLPADIFARYQRAKGNTVLMVSGSDCYGTPITVQADKEKTTPQKVVDEYHPRVVSLFKLFGLDYDLYTRTNTKNHQEVTRELFKDLAKEGYITKKTSNQFYSETDKKFLPDRYVEGKCPNCGAEKQRSDQCEVCGKLLSPEEVIEPYSKLTGSKVSLKETEHYFINLPKAELALTNFIESHKDIWRNDSYQESLAFIKQGLNERAITRDIDWGIEIPELKDKELKLEGIKDKRFYVWFDAVTGYYSATIEYFKLKNGNETVDPSMYIYNPKIEGKWEDYWLNPDSEHYYFMGKDNLLFHAIIWPAQLMGANKGYTLPHFLARNQFMNLEGKKFSKSRGWVIDSKEIVEKYGIDTVRFYLCLNFPESKDSNFTWKDFVETNNSILVGNIGNFINRTLSFINANYEGKVPLGTLDQNVKEEIDNTFKNVSESIEKVRLIEATQRICELSNFGNKYFNDNKIWELIKTDKERASVALYNSVQIISCLAKLLHPFIPEGAEKIAKELNVNFDKWDYELTMIAPGNQVNFTGPIFRKIDPVEIKVENDKLNIKEN
ncbi:MAG: methionine--tRNA ligase [bacterium]